MNDKGRRFPWEYIPLSWKYTWCSFEVSATDVASLTVHSPNGATPALCGHYGLFEPHEVLGIQLQSCTPVLRLPLISTPTVSY